MASETGSTPFPLSGAGARSKGAAVIARLDRIPVWSLSYLFIGIIGIGFLFTFLDDFGRCVCFLGAWLSTLSAEESLASTLLMSLFETFSTGSSVFGT